MLSYHQRGDVLAHSIGLLRQHDRRQTDLVDHITESQGRLQPGVVITVGLRRSKPNRHPPPTGVRHKGAGQDTAFTIFTSGTTGHPEASVADAPALAQGAGPGSADSVCGCAATTPVLIACRCTTTTR